MSRLNVALLAMKPRLRDILSRAIQSHDGLALVDWRPDAPRPPSEPFPDVFVQEVADPGDASLPTDLLSGPMRGRVLVVSETGSDAAIYELRLDRSVMTNVAIDQIIKAIRFGVAGAGWAH
jgi:hypothetical protein